MKTNVLKKVQINPLGLFGLRDEVVEHEAIKTDEQLAAFYHKMLTQFEDRPLVLSFIYAMISFSINYRLGSLKTEV